MSEEPQTDRDYAYLEAMHEISIKMGLSATETIKIAKTASDIDPTAMQKYIDAHILALNPKSCR